MWSRGLHGGHGGAPYRTWSDNSLINARNRELVFVSRYSVFLAVQNRRDVLVPTSDLWMWTTRYLLSVIGLPVKADESREKRSWYIEE